MAIRYEPFRELVSLREAMNSLLEDSFVQPGRLASVTQGPNRLPVDILQTENELIVRAAVPGIRLEDMSISVLNNVLTLKGESKPETPEAKAQHLRQELQYGVFERAFELPIRVQADQADARFEHGILTVKLPKAEDAKPRQIKIQVQSPAIEGKAS